ncbi:MAG: hypothetical protein J6A23_14740 [Thermoguttaceae bacterium]|nr:hypothetical protein [Thermoguttaceae bacterium]
MSIENIKDRLAGKKPEILPRYQSKGFGVKFYELKEVAEANPENRSAKALGAFYEKEKHRIAPNTVVYPDRTLREAALEGVEVEVVETSDDEGTGTVKKLEKKKKRETKTS